MNSMNINSKRSVGKAKEEAIDNEEKDLVVAFICSLVLALCDVYMYRGCKLDFSWSRHYPALSEYRVVSDSHL